MKKSIIKIASFVLVGCILLTLLSHIFDGGRLFSEGWIYDRTARYAAISEEIPDQIDVINLGDSLSICAITPPELYRDFGITAYNIGQDMQFPVESYYALLHALETQSPKVVLLETNSIFYENTLEEESEKTLSEILQYTFPFLRFHNLWKIPFKYRSIRTYFKGYTINEMQVDYTFDKDYISGNTERYPVKTQQLLQLLRLQKLCQDSNIRLVLYSSASIMNYYTMRKHNTLQDFALKYGFEFIDANYDRDLVGMNWPTDTWDNGDHLNLWGCRKTTAYLGTFLRDKCKIPDHRGDPEYKNWDDMLAVYDEEVEKMKGVSYANIEKRLGFPDY